MRRDKQVEENIKKMQDLGLNKYTSVLNNSLPPSASTKGKNAANKKTNSSDSDSYVSVYLLDDDDQGDTDDDDTESYEQPQPLQLRCSFSLQSSGWQIVALHFIVFNLVFNICSCF
jgi:hypothetical protein